MALQITWSKLLLEFHIHKEHDDKLFVFCIIYVFIQQMCSQIQGTLIWNHERYIKLKYTMHRRIRHCHFLTVIYMSRHSCQQFIIFSFNFSLIWWIFLVIFELCGFAVISNQNWALIIDQLITKLFYSEKLCAEISGWSCIQFEYKFFSLPYPNTTQQLMTISGSFPGM